MIADTAGAECRAVPEYNVEKLTSRTNAPPPHHGFESLRNIIYSYVDKYIYVYIQWNLENSNRLGTRKKFDLSKIFLFFLFKNTKT